MYTVEWDREVDNLLIDASQYHYLTGGDTYVRSFSLNLDLAVSPTDLARLSIIPYGWKIWRELNLAGIKFG